MFAQENKQRKRKNRQTCKQTNGQRSNVPILATNGQKLKRNP
jgi:hypothetical protein